MTNARRERLRETFTQDPELYDRARPGYPPSLFEDLARLTGVGPGSRVLEVGCGTGKSTWPLAERGCRIVAVELGEEMAAMARRKLSGFPDVEVVHSAFEDWPLPAEPFDLVFSATAFHWIDPAVRVSKSADALRIGGAIATIATHHVKDGHEELFEDLDRCFERWDPGMPTGMPAAAAIAMESAEIDGSGRFGAVEFRRHGWEVDYSAEAYLDLTRTYSRFGVMEAEAQRGLLRCLRQAIHERHSGRVPKPFLGELRVAVRTA